MTGIARPLACRRRPPVGVADAVAEEEVEVEDRDDEPDEQKHEDEKKTWLK